MSHLAIFSLLLAPFALQTVAAVIHRMRERPQAGGRLAHSAHDWLTTTIDKRGIPVGIEVHGQDGLDAYWPAAQTIGLSQQTASSHRPIARTIAAHELGHATTLTRREAWVRLLPWARTIQPLAGSWVMAFVATGVLLGGSPLLTGLGIVAGLVAITASALVCVDEALASRQALRWLATSVPKGTLPVCEQSLTSAFTIYGAELLGRVILMPALVWGLPTLPGVSYTPPDVLIGASLLLLPMLLLRALSIVDQVAKPTPVTNAFRLQTVMQRDARWEGLTAMAALWMALTLFRFGQGHGFSLALAFALSLGLMPLAAIGRMLVWLPLMLLLKRFSPPREQTTMPATIAEAPDALLAMYSSPPLQLVAHRLSGLSFVPLALWVFTTPDAWSVLVFSFRG